MAEAPVLRRQLLTWLLAPLFLLLAVDTAVSYGVALRFSQRAYDRSLLEIARDISLHLGTQDGVPVLRLPEAARDVLLSDPMDRVAMEVTTASGTHLAGERLPPGTIAAPVNGAREYFYDAELAGESVRVVQLSVVANGATGTPTAVVRVAETKHRRDLLAREILASVVLPQALLILVAGVVVWIGVVHGLAPLENLRRSLSLRRPDDQSALPTQGIPAEVLPLLAAINQLVNRLENSLAIRHRFIGDAAHQLKTPITVLQTQLELAARAPDPAQMRDALERSRAGLARLSRVVSQLLSLARNEPEAGEHVALSMLDLNTVAMEAAASWVPEALKRNIDLGFEPAARAVAIRGDAVRLRELLDNLLDNAVRYTREGGRITVRVRDTPTAGVDVNDDGPSIPPAERDRVFERFHRLLGNTDDGSGLGLAIAREIASLHGATIDLREDTDGIGNTFSVSFPAL